MAYSYDSMIMISYTKARQARNSQSLLCVLCVYWASQPIIADADKHRGS